jgi:hypothetical protein
MRYVWLIISAFLVHIGEGLFVAYFESFYILEHWGNWSVNVGFIVGVLARAKAMNQLVENFHHLQKKLLGTEELRVSLCRLLTRNLPIVLRKATNMIDSALAAHKEDGGSMTYTCNSFDLNAIILAEAIAITDTACWFVVFGSLITNDLIYVVRATTNSPDVTRQIAQRYLQTIIGVEPLLRVSRRITPAAMTKVFDITHGFHTVTVRACAPGAENKFFKLTKLNHSLGDESLLPPSLSEQALFLDCNCTFFISTLDCCEHALAVAEELGLCVLQSLACGVGAGRNGIGRKPGTQNPLSKKARKTRDEAYWVAQIQKTKPGKWMKTNVMRRFDHGTWMGVVRGLGCDQTLFKVVYEQVPAGYGDTEELTRAELAAGIVLAAELGIPQVTA